LISPLNPAAFQAVIKDTCLFALDLLVFDRNDRLLVGRRRESPARGYFFVPGGRVRKGEKLASAFERLLESELALQKASVSPPQLRGLYEHFYDDNAFGHGEFGTHYVVAALSMYLQQGAAPRFAGHDDPLFLSVDDVLAKDDIHGHVKRYFDTPSTSFPNAYGP
jgi:colanic acid biosynthesis protein WcaH